MQELTHKDLYDILTGCTILGTGGGGLLEIGLEKIDMVFKAGKKIRLVTLDEVPEDDLIITPYYCGAISPETDEIRQKYGHLKEMIGEPVVKAVQVMEKYLSRNINGVIPTELGGANTAAAFVAGAMLDKYIVDGDPAGRAVPELQHSTYFMNNIAMAPIAIVNGFGESAVFVEVVDDFRAEAMVRSIAVASKNYVAVADHLTTAKRLKGAIIPGTISYAQKIGKTYREALKMHEDPGVAIAFAGNGAIAFRGVVRNFSWDTIEGFTVGEVSIDGSSSYTGQEMRVWFKNEHIISWLNNRPYICAPDLICLMNSKTGKPICNPFYEIGMSITAIALPSPKEWITPAGLEVFSARYFGFDIDYVPFTSRIDENGRIVPQK